MGTDWPMIAGVAAGPAFLLNQFGEGSVVTFAASRTIPPKNRPYVLPGGIKDKPIFRATIAAKGVPASSR